MTQLQKFIAILNLNIKANIFFFKFIKTKFILQLVKLLVKYNYFIGYKVCSLDSSKLIIFFKLNLEYNKPFMVSCKQVSSSSRPVYVKFNQLSQFSSSLLILSTTCGVMTHKEA
jgi:ribosomal protein S8